MALYVQAILGFFLVLSSMGVIFARKPVYSSLSFLVALLMLAALYLQLSAEFIAVMQVLVYAGAILVLFIFVIVLFQDAHQKINLYAPKSSPILIGGAVGLLLASYIYLASKLKGIFSSQEDLPPWFGTVEALGKALYLDYFFPFEAVILLFLIAIVGSLFIAKKER
ncbi:NADH-quinone oxidoreductase subunit J [Criblamydia sequanensis]|uniref:NADH-quinone oxidoreductase subunit J n=1 Tax=Candidatus Criblamydia sequanensis CRIB-18 TaxID=1437425 RepID=A0A090CYH2_9BACT|nr:NADH-quinone oxidoreductase subunit J [Criblamydia sequanensis]CDR33441.1 NADH-quinone oxidoreductase subunit J [Criblamydia sequanensis CRIB-18]